LNEEVFQNWEIGSSSDEVRNHFLIPRISEIVRSLRPARILDVGCSTGYLARQIDKDLDYRPSWTLLDHNEDVLRFAEDLLPPNFRGEFVASDYESYVPDHSYETIIISFTLLEMADSSSVLRHSASLLVDNGQILISLPDSLADIVDYAEELQTFAPLRTFLTTDVSIPKTDKFTGEAYPFSAKRVTRTISQAMSEGLSLTTLLRAEVDGRGVYLIALQKG